MHGLALRAPDEQAVLRRHSSMPARPSPVPGRAGGGHRAGPQRLCPGRYRSGGKAGELALLFVRCYRGLFVLMGGRLEDMRHWMHTPNRDTGGIPAEQVRSVQGLARVVEYLDAMRGKV